MMETVNFELLSREFKGNTVETWLIAFGITLVIWGVLFLLRRAAVTAVKRLTTRTAFAWDDVLAAVIPKTHGLFLLTLALYAGSHRLGSAWSAKALSLVVVVGLIQVGLWGTAAVSFFVREQRERFNRPPVAGNTDRNPGQPSPQWEPQRHPDRGTEPGSKQAEQRTLGQCSARNLRRPEAGRVHGAILRQRRAIGFLSVDSNVDCRPAIFVEGRRCAFGLHDWTGT